MNPGCAGGHPRLATPRALRSKSIIPLTRQHRREPRQEVGSPVFDVRHWLMLIAPAVGERMAALSSTSASRVVRPSKAAPTTNQQYPICKIMSSGPARVVAPRSATMRLANQLQVKLGTIRPATTESSASSQPRPAVGTTIGRFCQCRPAALVRAATAANAAGSDKSATAGEHQTRPNGSGRLARPLTSGAFVFLPACMGDGGHGNRLRVVPFMPCTIQTWTGVRPWLR